MIKPSSLLDFAFHEVYYAELTPKPEAATRRAISACYYALFHELALAGASLFSGSEDQRAWLARAYDHSALGNAAKEIEKRQSPRPDGRLLLLAAALKRLREAREQADYDLTASVSWDDADEMLGEAMLAFNLIHQLKDHPEMTELLLSALIARRRRG